MFDLEINGGDRVGCWLFNLKGVLIFKYMIDFELFELKLIIL